MSAATLTGPLDAKPGTIRWKPQSLKTLRMPEVKHLFLGTNLLVLTAITLWCLYGLMPSVWPLILANIFSILCVGTIVGPKLPWGRMS